MADTSGGIAHAPGQVETVDLRWEIPRNHWHETIRNAIASVVFRPSTAPEVGIQLTKTRPYQSGRIRLAY
jgi:hypothetical protein